MIMETKDQIPNTANGAGEGCEGCPVYMNLEYINDNFDGRFREIIGIARPLIDYLIRTGACTGKLETTCNAVSTLTEDGEVNHEIFEVDCMNSEAEKIASLGHSIGITDHFRDGGLVQNLTIVSAIIDHPVEKKT